MPDTAEYSIHQIGSTEIVAIVDYTAQPACGDGWNEPHEPAHIEIGHIKLIKITNSYERVGDTGKLSDYQRVRSVTDLGEAPEWVYEIIYADEDWQSDLLANDGPDPDRAYDERRDLEMMER